MQGSATKDYQQIIRGVLTQQTGSDHPRGAASDFVDGLLALPRGMSPLDRE